MKNFEPEDLLPFKIGDTVHSSDGRAQGRVIDLHSQHGVKVRWDESWSTPWMLPQHLRSANDATV